MNYKISFEELEKELKTLDYSLITYTDSDIKIKKISTITIFIIILMSFVGISFMVMSYVSIFVLSSPEFIAGAVLAVVGIAIVLFPVYKYYSHKYFEIDFNGEAKLISIKYFDPLPVKHEISFDDIDSVQLKKMRLNSDVNAQTKSSYVYVYTISLMLKNKIRKELIKYTKRDERYEQFSLNFTNLLIDITGKSKNLEEVTA